MADYLVLEEDGTSRIELEDGSGFLITEESSPATRSASFTAEASIDATPSPPPPSYATWKVGTITVPGSPGGVSVTGLEGTPAAVFFFGTNWTTEDTAVTGTGTGVFRGWAAPKWDDPGTILQFSSSLIPAGDCHVSGDGWAINMLDTSGGLSAVYGATFETFDADGFTVDFFTASGGGYKIVYVALMDVTQYGSYVGFGATLGLGWKAGASMVQGVWGGPFSQDADMTREYFGGAAYPGTSDFNWMGAGLTAYSFPTSAFAQYLTEIYNDTPDTVIAQIADFIGPSMTPQNMTAYPSGGLLTDFTVSAPTTASNTTATVVVWDDEDSATGRELPSASTAGTVTVSGLPFEPGLVVGYTISNEPPGQGSSNPFGARGAVGFSVVTPDFQWCAVVDGVDDRGAFQSFQRGFADTVDGTDVHAGTVELTQDGFVMTTEEDSTTAHDWVWHAFGHPERIVKWIPHIYRRVLG